MFLAPAIAGLVLGLWGGLARLGWPVGSPAGLAAVHGPLMVVGFLGTVIGIERAVALARPWGWVGPALSAAGALLVAAGEPAGAFLASAGAISLVAVFAALLRREPALHIAVITVGAACGAVGTSAWAIGAAIPAVTGWWGAFLVLTIAGERLELSRLRNLGPPARLALVSLVCAALVSLVAAWLWPMVGVRALGVVWLLLAGWLWRNDMARTTVRIVGLPRFVAVSLLIGYLWLGVAGATMTASGPQTGGFGYDAQLHALFAGFVLSMIFGHAPIVFPAVLRLNMPFHPAAWAPLVLLHASLVVRIGADFASHPGARAIGGLVGVLAAALFLVVTFGTAISTVYRGFRRNSAASMRPWPQEPK